MAESYTCPRCQSRWPIRLGPGEMCGACESSRVWAELDAQAARIVITRAELAAVGRAPDRRRVAAALSIWAVPLALSAAALGGAARAFLRFAAPQRLGPLGDLISGQQSLLLRGALLAALCGLLAGAVQVRGGRRLAQLGGPGRGLRLGAIVLGGGALCTLLALLLGALTLPSLAGWRHTAPPFRAAEADEDAERVERATVMIVAPDSDGDARHPALGTGLVIRARPDRVWVLTNSHVAVPHTAFAALERRPVPSQVFVTFADGRGALGQVRWTARAPLDAAVVEVPLKDPPPPIELDRGGAVLPGSPVFFVPNPLRGGWLVHRGVVLNLERHRPGSGDYDMIYTNLPIQPGDSGSGLFIGGRLVGLNTWMKTGEAHPVTISLSSADIRGYLDALAQGGPS